MVLEVMGYWKEFEQKMACMEMNWMFNGVQLDIR